jgi:hypothetical protein
MSNRAQESASALLKVFAMFKFTPEQAIKIGSLAHLVEMFGVSKDAVPEGLQYLLENEMLVRDVDLYLTKLGCEKTHEPGYVAAVAAAIGASRSDATPPFAAAHVGRPALEGTMTYGEAALTKQDAFGICFYVMEALGGRDFDVLTPGERIFALASRLVNQVCNGGFDQYFFNGGGDYVHETAKALGEIGASQTQELVQRAIQIAQFPEPVPADYDYYDTETEDVRRQLNDLDQQFYSSSLDDLEVYPRLVEYLREHTEEFS